MGHGPSQGDAVAATGDHRGGAGGPGDVGRSGDPRARTDAVEPAQREVPHLAAGRRLDDPGGLARHHGLVVDDGEEGGLQEGGLDPRSAHPQQRDCRARHRPLGDGVEVPAETEPGQKVEKAAIVGPQAAEPGQHPLVEAKSVQVLDGGLKPGGDEVGAMGREVADRQLEHAVLVLPVAPERLGHDQQVLVAVEGQTWGRVGGRDHACVIAHRRAASLASAVPRVAGGRERRKDHAGWRDTNS